MSLYIVLADFHAQEEEELSLPAGSAVEVLRFGEDGWADVVYQQCVGICPNAYLKLATEVEIPATPPAGPAQTPEASEPCQPSPATVRASPVNRNAGRPLPAPGSSSTPSPTTSATPARGTATRGTRGANAPQRGASRGAPRGTPRGAPRGAPRGQAPATTRGAPRGQAPATRGSTRGAPRGRAEVRARGGERGVAAPRGSRRAAPVSRRERAADQPPSSAGQSDKTVEGEEAQALASVVDEEVSVEENSDSSTSADDSAKREAQRKHRKMVLAEILQTERDYVNDIEIVAVVFIRPLLEKNIISREDHTLLFSNLEVLVHVNQQLLNRLQGEEDLECLRVGIIFLEMAEYFKTYASYCANQPKFIATLNRLNEENTTFDHYLYEQTSQNERCRGLDLFSFLIKPIQRICKYPLLLRDLLKVTPEDHFDRPDLLKALVKIEEVVSYVNDRKRLAENLQKILDVQEQIESNVELSLVEPSRRFVREGSLQVVENGRVRDRNTYVFNDLIVLTKPKRSMMGYAAKDHFKAQFYLNDIKIVDMADTDDLKNACQVLPKNEDKKFDFVFMFESPHEKAEWVKEIKTLVREFQLKELRAAQEAKAKREGEEAPSPPTTNNTSGHSRRERKAAESSQDGPSSPVSRRAPAPTRGSPATQNTRGNTFNKPTPPGQGRNLTGRPTNSPTPPPAPAGTKGKLKSFFR